MHVALTASLMLIPSLQPGTPTPTPSPSPATAPAPAATPAKPAGEPGKDAAKPGEPGKEPAKDTKPADPYILGYTVKDIDGKDQKLEQYKGKVLLIVNVASKCGLTPQYEKLQKLYDAKKKDGFEILAFPANNFAGQEPGQDADIKQFCTEKYGVTFPVFSKISVKGEDQHPLYKQLAGQAKPVGGDPAWNFTKFLVGRDGKVIARFEPRTDPEDTTLVKKIEELLKDKAPAAGKPAEGGKEPAAPKK